MLHLICFKDIFVQKIVSNKDDNKLDILLRFLRLIKFKTSKFNQRTNNEKSI